MQRVCHVKGSPSNGTWMELLENSEQIEAFRRGDRAVLEEVYRHYVDDVEAMLRGGFTFTSQGETVRFRGIREPFRLQEAVQESFIKAFRESARQAYDGSRAYRPYLFTIARNLIIDQYRRKSLESQLFVHLGDMAYQDEDDSSVLGRLAADGGEPSPEETAWQNQLAGSLRAFIDELDTIESRILQEYLLGSQTQQGMADALGVSRNDVRKHIREIRSRLLRHLKSEGIIGSLEVAEVFRAATTLIALGVVL